MKKITKAVIPVAGLGTRFLPYTQAIPKEMLPLIDTPILWYIVKEAIDAGYEDIVLIQGRNKGSIENFFDKNYELEDKLEKSGKLKELELLHSIQNSANIISIRQKEAKGLGHAVLCSQPIVGDEAFSVLLGDEVMLGNGNPSKQLRDHFIEHQNPVVSVMEVPEDQTHLYGIADYDENSFDGLAYKATNFVEKPKPGTVKSRFALPGRYVFLPSIFDYIKSSGKGVLGEIQLTDSMQTQSNKEGMWVVPIDANRFDTGNKLGYLQANIFLAMQQEEYKDKIVKFIEGLK
ncbi:MAG: UTP--glucose-1-phosphate uridylyltransferase [Bdellovibrionales bacterium]